MKDNPENVITVMVVDDDPSVRQLISKHLSNAGYRVSNFADAETCLRAFAEEPSDVLLTDIDMPGMDGISLLAEVKKLQPSTEVVVITGKAQKENAIQALKKGAFDFFEKPVDLGELIETIHRTVRYQTLLKERDRLSRQVAEMSEREAKRWGASGIVGSSSAMKKVLAAVEALRKTDRTTVLIQGESGTGKELVARAIHIGSSRASRPFIAVNCAAIPEQLAESVFFGHVRGAFTGAAADAKGCFDTADGGTLFLDEIGDMPSNLQTVLLRVLEDGIIVPVGSQRGHSVNVRVIAATNANLSERVASGRFRQDLYYRLARYTIDIPPLRTRKEDIPPLAEHFVKLLAGEMGITPPALGTDVMASLKAYDYPGNVRELKNIIERALIEAGGKQIAVSHLHYGPGRAVAPPSVSGSVPRDAPPADGDSLPLNLKEAERALVRRAMEAAGGNMSKAAQLLGISRAKAYRLIREQE